MKLENLESIAGVSADAIVSEAKELLDKREWDGITEMALRETLRCLCIVRTQRFAE